MARRRYIAWNGAAGALGVTSVTDLTFVTIPTALTATAGTLQQLKSSAGNISIIEWGYQTSVVPTAAVNIELISTGTVACTSLTTAYASADLIKYDDSGAVGAAMTLSTSASGFWTSGSTAEGTLSGTRLLDTGPAWSQYYSHQFPLDREPGHINTEYLRIRAYSATAIGVKSYIIWEE